jgi:hypothetical protein
VYAANLRTAHHRSRCERALTELFNDESAEVRAAAAGAIRRLEAAELAEFAELAGAFVESRAFDDNSDDMLWALHETTASVPELALDTCERLLAAFRIDAETPRSTIGPEADQISQILVRAYADGTAALKARALDLIDQSLELNIYGAHQALMDHDRPWIASAA